jgi:hypothetical protein
MRTPAELKARFDSKWLEDDATGCWVWQRATSRGYGVTHLDSRGPQWRAHRLSYELHVGPIPAGMDLDHLCRNRACVNPEHLEPVTRHENLMRGDTIAARNAAKTHCVRGHELTGDNVKVLARGRRCIACARLACQRQRDTKAARPR